MIYTIITTFLITTILSQPSSFNNLPDSTLTKFQGDISCKNTAFDISGTFANHYKSHAWQFTNPKNIGCKISANLTSSKTTSISVYTTDGKPFPTSQLSFKNTPTSSYFIVLSTTKFALNSTYKFALSCSTNCQPKKIRRLASSESVVSVASVESVESVESESISDSVSNSFSNSTSSDSSDSLSNSSSNSNSTSWDSDDYSNSTYSNSSSISNSTSSDSVSSESISISVESVSLDVSVESGETVGIVSESDEVVVETPSTVAVAPKKTKIKKVKVKSGSDSGDNALVGGGEMDDIRFEGGDEEDVQDENYEIVINLSRSAALNLWGVVVLFLFLCVGGVWCFTRSGKRKIKYVDEVGSNSNRKTPLP